MSKITNYQIKIAVLLFLASVSILHGKILFGPILQEATENSMTIWWGADEPGTSKVFYGKTSINQDSTAAEGNGTHVTDGGFDFYRHRVKITGLEPGVRYKYAIKTNGIAPAWDWASSTAFRTAPAPGNNWTCMIIGDVCYVNQPPLEKFFASFKADMAITVGDFIYNSYLPNRWYTPEDQVTSGGAGTGSFNPIGAYGELFANTVVYFTMGNHEFSYTDTSRSLVWKFLDYYPFPYAFRYSNAYFLMFNNMGDVSYAQPVSPYPRMKDAAQRAALAESLGIYGSSASWKFYTQHYAIITHKPNGTMRHPAQAEYEYMQDNGIDFCISAHTHYFLRTQPFKDGSYNLSWDAESAAQPPDGPIYILEGAALRFDRTDAQPTPEMPGVTELRGISLMEVRNNELEFWRINWEDAEGNKFPNACDTIDHFIIKKPGGITQANQINYEGNKPVKVIWVKPNPFNGTTIIYFDKSAAPVQAGIYNLTGTLIKKIKLNHLTENFYWDGTDRNGNLLPAGSYFISVKAKNQFFQQKFTLLR
ncbi:MAG: FlgD immunoglobulin-like domain containing protein [bacterium]